MTSNNLLLTLIFILTILTIIHIAYYLFFTSKRRMAVPTGSLKGNVTNGSSKLLDNNAQKPKETKSQDQNVFYTQSDNFQKIEGIGPAIEETLKTAGIRTYKQLADADYSTLKSILMSKGSKFVMHDPRNWPKQAKLASEGKWEELDKVKEDLIRGK
ncbi:MAG: helix-hairpin-helix domain-containing protein [Patescibacteria group bacterium]